MQRHLLLLRHAKSSWDSPGRPDHARPLSGRGRRAAPAMGRWLGRHLPRPDLVLCSDAMRTRETLDRLGSVADGWPVQVESELYLADTEDLLHRIAHVPDAVAVLLVIGHNPGLHDLALELAGTAADAADDRRLRSNLPTGGLVHLSADLARWRHLAPRVCVLESFTAPKDLPEAREHRL